MPNTARKQELAEAPGAEEAPADYRPIRDVEVGRFAERLRALIGDRELRTVARNAGVSEGAVRKWRDGKTVPSLDYVPALAAATGVDPLWLAFGLSARGESLGLDEFVLVPRYAVEVSAGHGASPDAEAVADRLAFRKDWVNRELGVSPSDLAIVTARGDSMEPTLREGAILLLDTSRKQLGPDGIYVLRRDHHLLAKRLQRSRDPDLVWMRSDNPAYEDIELPLAELDILGRVIWVGARL